MKYQIARVSSMVSILLPAVKLDITWFTIHITSKGTDNFLFSLSFISTLPECTIVLINISCSFLWQKKLFDEKWHQLRLLVTEEDVTLYVDDLEIESLSLEPPVGIFINGKTQVGKYVSKETTAPVSSKSTILLSESTHCLVMSFIQVWERKNTKAR